MQTKDQRRAVLRAAVLKDYGKKEPDLVEAMLGEVFAALDALESIADSLRGRS